MRSTILFVCLALLIAAPAASFGNICLKIGGIPAQVEAGRDVTVDLTGIIFGTLSPREVIISGNSIVLDLFFFTCPLTCEPGFYDFEIPIGPLQPGDYTITAEIDGIVFDTLELEVVAGAR